MINPLTSDQRAWLQSELEKRRDALSQQLAEHLHGSSRVERAADVASQDADDAPQRRPERETAMALSDRERHDLDAASAALQRLSDPHFGVCADCGIDIPFERLQAEPWALRCVDCESRREQAIR